MVTYSHVAVRDDDTTGQSSRAGSLTWDRLLCAGSDTGLLDTAPNDRYHVIQVESGLLTASDCSTEVEVGPGASLVIDPHAHCRLRPSPDLRVLNVRFTKAGFDRCIRDLFGRQAPSTVTFDLAPPANEYAQARWNTAIHMILQIIEGAQSDERSSVWRDQVERFAVATLLDTHANTAQTPGGRLRAGAGAPRAIRAAADHLAQHADEPVRINDVAASVGLTPRALQLGFRRAYDMTASQYLRELRLQHAHHDVVNNDRFNRTIAEIAYRWGFSSPSRFAAYYRERYGQSPSVIGRG